MRVRFGLTCILAIVAVQLGSAHVPVQQPPAAAARSSIASSRPTSNRSSAIERSVA